MSINLESGESREISDQEILKLAIESGRIKKTEIYDLKLGTVESFTGEAMVEINGQRYKVVGYPHETAQGKIVRKGWVRIFKMQSWQE